MRSKSKDTPAPDRIADRELMISDSVGLIAHEVSIVQSLAAAATAIGGSTADDHTCRRHLADLVAQIENAAREAWGTAHALDQEINPNAR